MGASSSSEKSIRRKSKKLIQSINRAHTNNRVAKPIVTTTPTTTATATTTTATATTTTTCKEHRDDIDEPKHILKTITGASSSTEKSIRRKSKKLIPGINLAHKNRVAKPIVTTTPIGTTTCKEHRDDIDEGSHRGHVIDYLKERIAEESFEVNNIGVDIRTSASVSIETLYDGVKDGPVVGYGMGGVVRTVTHKITGIEYAVKYLSTERIDMDKALLQLREEIEILIGLDHPNIVKVEGVYESIDKIYIVQELCRGGDLFDRVDAQPEEHYNEAQCARLVKQMLSAVRYIHSKGIVHRDLKLENFLFDHAGADSELKMIDFGLSKHFKSGDIHHEFVGTRYTVAPEVLGGSYDERVDIWAIGVLTFILLSGHSPFGGCGDYDRSPNEVRTNILSANFTFEPEEIWRNVSDQAKHFISSTLVVDPTRRLTVEQCQTGRWIQEWTVKERKEGNKLNPNVISALRSFGKLSDVRKLLCEVIGFTLLPHQISDLRKEFDKLDVEQTGEISLQSLKKVLLENAGSGALGTVTEKEKEVENIFYSLRLHKDHLQIHWHEFIAAGLSQCCVEDSNLLLAFNRIDAEKKGYITFDDFIGFIGPTRLSEDQSMKELWQKSYRGDSKIYYDEFKELMEED